MVSVKHIARLTVIAFLFNALLPFFAVYNVPAQAMESKQLSSVFGEEILICTGEGFKWVSWKDLQNQKQHDAPDHAKCPLCYLAAHGLNAVTPEVLALVAPSYGSVRLAFIRYQLAQPSLAAALGSRAPPASSFS